MQRYSANRIFVGIACSLTSLSRQLFTSLTLHQCAKIVMPWPAMLFHWHVAILQSVSKLKLWSFFRPSHPRTPNFNVEARTRQWWKTTLVRQHWNWGCRAGELPKFRLRKSEFKNWKLWQMLHVLIGNISLLSCSEACFIASLGSPRRNVVDE